MARLPVATRESVPEAQRAIFDEMVKGAKSKGNIKGLLGSPTHPRALSARASRLALAARPHVQQPLEDRLDKLPQLRLYGSGSDTLDYGDLSGWGGDWT